MVFSDLIDRVSEAQVADEDLDVEIAYATGFWPEEHIKMTSRDEDGNFLLFFSSPAVEQAPPVTSSVDAARDLARRLFPASWGGLVARADAEPLAIVAEVLRAVQASDNAAGSRAHG